jgi:hypothetical protein
VAWGNLPPGTQQAPPLGHLQQCSHGPALLLAGSCWTSGSPY